MFRLIRTGAWDSPFSDRRQPFAVVSPFSPSAGDTSRARAYVGLSPPMRGNPAGTLIALAEEGSIPAHAGEPRPHFLRVVKGEVYPRPRGGTCVFNPQIVASEGLSPPTRGNRRGAAARAVADGSIPAHAGEPSEPSPRTARSRVYPRPRGGTSGVCGSCPQAAGLSPPTRGNHCRGVAVEQECRSIPAHAGEPRT